ncbi:MAG: hypothetical protein AAFU79_19125 [Myxococcota bacterium]
MYARTLGAGINHFNQGHVICNLLASGAPRDPADREEEGALIRVALRAMPPQRALRALEGLRSRGVNNRRTRAVVRDYLGSRPDPAFDAVKYRAKVRSVAVHNHVRFDDERSSFLFRGWKERQYTTRLFERFRQAHFAEEPLYDLPFSVAEGLARRHGVPRARFLARAESTMTVAERVRMETSTRRAGLAKAADLTRVPLTKLALYILGLAPEQRREQRERFERALQDAVRRALRRSPKRLGRVAAVLDRSYSTSGSVERRRRPLGVSLAVSRLLRACSIDYRAYWTLPAPDELLVTPHGQTDLAGPLLAALRHQPDVVVIVSDGHENAPPRGAAEVARVFRRRLDPERKTSIVHVNPVFDAEVLAPRTLGEAIPTVGIRDAEDLLTVLGFARFADGFEPLKSLEAYLQAKARAFIQGES